MFYRKLLFSAFICSVILIGCAAGPPRAARNTVRWAEKECHTYDCFMESLGNKKQERSIDRDGNQVVVWYMSVTKTRPLDYGEEPLDGRYYRYYDEDCWFTAVFAPDGAVLNTNWKGPGCWGRGK